MRRHALRLFKLWLIRQLTFLPLIVLLAVGFRPGSAQLTPEARWHPAFTPAGPLALLVLVAMALGWLPFDPTALGMLLFVLVGCAGIIALGLGHDAIHLVYTPMAQAMLFVWIFAVFAVMAPWQPGRLLGVPPVEIPKAGRRLSLAAAALVALAALSVGASWLLRRHEVLAGLLPFLGVLAGKFSLKKWILHGLKNREAG